MDEWKEAFFTYDGIEAEIVRDLLEAEDIDVVVRSLKVSPYPVNVGKMGEIIIMVRESDLDKAANVLKIMSDKEGHENDI
jgi:hypothetical protein